MNYKQLSKQIKSGEFEQIYFLHGEEEYVKDRLYEQLYEKLAPPVMPEFNVNFLRAATDEAIIAACMTPPMMAEEKLVVVRDCALFGGDAAALLEGPFTVVTPDSRNPYRQMYAAN